LRHFAVPALVHTNRAIDALHQAAGSVSPAEDVSNGRDGLLAHILRLGQNHGTHQQHAPQGRCRLPFALQHFRLTP